MLIKVGRPPLEIAAAEFADQFGGELGPPQFKEATTRIDGGL